MPEEYMTPILEKLIPVLDDYMLAQLKMQNFRSKGFKDNKYMDKLQDISNNAEIEIYNICQKNQ